jgi:hypothetical protein
VILILKPKQDILLLQQMKCILLPEIIISQFLPGLPQLLSRPGVLVAEEATKTETEVAVAVVVPDLPEVHYRLTRVTLFRLLLEAEVPEAPEVMTMETMVKIR